MSYLVAFFGAGVKRYIESPGDTVDSWEGEGVGTSLSGYIPRSLEVATTALVCAALA